MFDLNDFKLGDIESLISNSNNLVIGGAFIVFLVTVILVGWYIYTNKLHEGFTSSASTSEGSNNANSKDLEVLFFYTDWCPHCKTAKPEWESVKSDLDGTQQNGFTLKFVDMNCTQESPEISELLKKYSIEGYPTIKAVKGGVITDYDAKPNKDTLTQFIQSLA